VDLKSLNGISEARLVLKTFKGSFSIGVSLVYAYEFFVITSIRELMTVPQGEDRIHDVAP